MKFLSLEEMDEVSVIGIQYGDEEEMFGRIEDMVIANNRVYVLDSNRQDVRVFTINGEYIATIGGRGEGPGEFQMAKSMAVYQDEWLHVSNGYRIEVYDITRETPEFVETVQHDKMIHSLCISADRLYLHSVQPLDSGDMLENYMHTLHAHSLPSHDHLFSFGQSYRHKDYAVIGRMTMGRLGCSDVSSMVVFAFERMPVLHGYSAIDGELKWKNRIDGVFFPSVTETNEGGRTSLTYKIPDNNIVDQLSASVGLGSENEVFQIIRTDVPEAGFEMADDRGIEVHTFVLNSSNGEAAYLSNKIPEIVSVSEHLIVSRDLLNGYTSSRIYRSDTDLLVP